MRGSALATRRRVLYTLQCVRGGWMGEQLAAERSGESLDHGGVAHVVVELPEVD